MIRLSNNEHKKILITLICMLLGALLPKSILWAFAAINVLTIGIIHGANDLFILSKYIKTPKKRQFSYLFGSYVIFVLAMVFALFHVPQWSLLLFVMVSAFHFGEQQWHKSYYTNATLTNLFYAFYGLFLFALLFCTHLEETIEIIHDISSIFLPVSFFWVLLGISFFATLVLLILNLNKFRHQLLFQFLALLVLSLLFFQTSLLWSFSVYFVLWHSLPSLNEQAQVLYPSAKKPAQVYIRFALPYWILAMAGFGVALFFYKENTDSLISLFFSFLAAITLPHVFVIFRMHQKK